jgi:outer membrane autotransporter protein
MPGDRSTGSRRPYLGLAYVQVDTGSFSKSGATAALTANDKYQGIGFSTLGARVATTVPVAGIMTTPHVSLAWQYAFGATTPEQGYVFASTGIGFGIAGVPLARSSALLEAGLDVAVAPNATLGLSYAEQLASSLQDNGVRGRLNWRY